jgi:hypothetical protein
LTEIDAWVKIVATLRNRSFGWMVNLDYYR